MGRKKNLETEEEQPTNLLANRLSRNQAKNEAISRDLRKIGSQQQMARLSNAGQQHNYTQATARQAYGYQDTGQAEYQNPQAGMQPPYGQAVPQQASYGQAMQQAAPQQASYGQVTQQAMPQQASYGQTMQQAAPQQASYGQAMQQPPQQAANEQTDSAMQEATIPAQQSSINLNVNGRRVSIPNTGTDININLSGIGGDGQQPSRPLTMAERQAQFLELDQKKKDARASATARLFINIMIVACVLATIYTIGVVFMFEVDKVGTMAMSPTYSTGDTVWCNKMVYRLSSPSYGDVVALKTPSGKKTILRVVGLPGDTVLIKNGILYINGLEQTASYPDMQYAGIAAETIILSDGQYFVLGDNRNDCVDSRNDSVAVVTLQDHIIGRISEKKAPSFLSFTGTTLTN